MIRIRTGAGSARAGVARAGVRVSVHTRAQSNPRIRDKIGRKNEIRGQPRQSYVQTQSQSIPNIPPSNLTPAALRPLPKSYIITPSMSLNTDWTPSGVTNHQHPQTYIPPQGLVTLAPLDLLTPNALYDLYSEYNPLPGPYNTGLRYLTRGNSTP